MDIFYWIRKFTKNPFKHSYKICIRRETLLENFFWRISYMQREKYINNRAQELQDDRDFSSVKRKYFTVDTTMNRNYFLFSISYLVTSLYVFLKNCGFHTNNCFLFDDGFRLLFSHFISFSFFYRKLLSFFVSFILIWWGDSTCARIPSTLPLNSATIQVPLIF